MAYALSSVDLYRVVGDSNNDVIMGGHKGGNLTDTKFGTIAHNHSRPIRILLDSGMEVHRDFLDRVAPFPHFQVNARALLDDQAARRTLCDLRVCVLGARHSDGWPIVQTIARLRNVYPHVGLCVVGSRSEGVHRQMVQFAGAGADDVFIKDVPSEQPRFNEMIERRLGAPPPEEALRLIADRDSSDGHLRRTVLWLLRNAYWNPPVEKAATLFGCDRSTLRRRLQRLGLPDPSTLIRAGRVLHALQFQEAERGSATRQARMLGLDSAAGTRMMLRRARLDTSLARAWQQLGLPRPW